MWSNAIKQTNFVPSMPSIPIRIVYITEIYMTTSRGWRAEASCKKQHFNPDYILQLNKMPPSPAPPLIVPAVRRHTATVIMSHGLGDSGAGWVSLAENWRRRQKFEEVKFIFPNAPMIPITVVSTKLKFML